MKKILLLLSFVVFCLVSFSQVYQEMPQYGYRANRMAFDSTLQIPTTCGVPTLKSNVLKKSAIAYDTCNGKFYTYNSKTFVWSEVSGSGGGAVFTKNIILNGSSTNRLGVWVNGDTIPVIGMALDSAFKVITQKAVAPTYVQPTATITSSPSSGAYEIGTNLGTITFGGAFTPNDAGALISSTYYRDGVALGGNTSSITSLTNGVNFRVQRFYGQGACKNNNLGVQDCTGRIQAGSVFSSYIYFTPYPYYYFGYSSTAIPTSATIVSANGGGNNFSFGSSIGNTIINVSGTLKYVYYAYPSSFGTLSSIIISGLESIGAFNLNVVSVTNSKGYTQNYNVYTSQNQFNNTTVTIQSAN